MAKTCFPTIKYEGFLYRIFADVNDPAIRRIVGDLECISVLSPEEPGHCAAYSVEDGQLYITGLSLPIDPEDLGKLAGTPHAYECEKKTGIRNTGSGYSVCEFLELTFRDLREPTSFTGSIPTKQIYIDEQERSLPPTHEKESTFCFRGGQLDVCASDITKDETTFISRFTWQDDRRPRPDPSQKSCRLFYVNPRGTLAQNNYLIDMLIAYRKSGRLPPKALDAVLSYRTPILRTVCQAETAPGSGIFTRQTADLVDIAIQSQDAALLKQLSPWIDFSQYPESYADICRSLLERGISN